MPEREMQLLKRNRVARDRLRLQFAILPPGDATTGLARGSATCAFPARPGPIVCRTERALADHVRYPDRRSEKKGEMRPVSTAERRICPDCGSDHVELTQRGYAGRTDERHQFFDCVDCGRTTYEILSRTVREMKLERVGTGDVIEADGHPYRILRMLKIGLDEHLLYVRADNDARRELRPGRRSNIS
jgi:hypothetical protein